MAEKKRVRVLGQVGKAVGTALECQAREFIRRPAGLEAEALEQIANGALCVRTETLKLASLQDHIMRQILPC